MRNIFKSITKLYWIGILKVYPVLLIIALIIFGPRLYQLFIVDNSYCVGSEERYLYNFENEIKRQKISALFVDKGVTSIALGEGRYSSALHTCSKFSNDEYNLPIDSLRVGDIIVKDSNSNVFTAIKKDKHYVFEIEKR
ncbi:hypothetical protein [Muriicola jejuensis]|uniref:Uncharacterized protein n=1 Tax=Muriicola jejuensis TaxID=504488 RepID=A0A6P0UGN3_9FLAO|nr:hypothetical protein [Muriicola jejuensis]NER11792.1 hypothetical protein [Muriicola jejuensis]